MNKRIRAILREVTWEGTQDRHKEKICLIEDIMKARRLLYGLGFEEYKTSITDPVIHFDHLYDLSPEKLREELQTISDLATKRAHELTLNY
jgi:hypothetical protein